MTNEKKCIEQADLRHHLKRIQLTIHHPAAEDSLLPEDFITKTFAEILSINPLDLVVGYKKNRKTKEQAVKNKARMLAAMIIHAITQVEPGFIKTDTILMDWNTEKSYRRWTKHSLKTDSQVIVRLDWFLYRRMIMEGSSVQRWLDSFRRIEISTLEDQESESDLEYDPNELLSLQMTEPVSEDKDDVKEQRPQKSSSKCFPFLCCIN